MNGFFGVGPLELVVIAVLALVVLGPERLPGVISQTMKVIREVRGYASQVQDELQNELRDVKEEFSGLSEEFNAFSQELAATATEVTSETQSVINELPTASELTAPPPPRDSVTDMTAPLSIRQNGASHADEEERPAFSDYRPS